MKKIFWSSGIIFFLNSCTSPAQFGSSHSLSRGTKAESTKDTVKINSISEYES